MDRPVRVLIADDNQADRLLLSRIVESEGHEVILAVDGLDAIVQFERCAPQLVLLDALMPRLDGFEVARRIKAAAGDAFIPVIFLTTLKAADELARCLEAGGDDFLSKPYNKVILRAKIAAFERMRQMHATLHAQRDQLRVHQARMVQEQNAAKQIFDRVAHSGCLDANNIKYLISPVAIFNGDVLLAARGPGGNMYVLLGDFTGHGLPASIGAMPLAEIFYGMTAKGFSIGDVLWESNRKLREILPVGFFCCAAMLDIDFLKGTVEIWNGGLPDVYVCHDNGGEVTSVLSEHLPLGVLEAKKFSSKTVVYDLAIGDRVLMCTDGIIEARNAAGEMFGADRVEAVLSVMDSSVRSINEIRRQLASHVDGQSKDDDYSMVEVSMLEHDAVSAPLPVYPAAGPAGPKDWELSYVLGASSLASFNPVPLLQQILMEVPELRKRGGDIFTVLSELYSNALDHGVMGLSSVKKRTPEGFSCYYLGRAKRLSELTEGSIRFDLISRITPAGGELTIRIVDSGAGFDHARYDPSTTDGSQLLHGRGLPLLHQLTDQLTHHGCGNHTEAVFSWRAAHD